MERHVTQALHNYGKGYTCAQAVLCAYAQDMGLDMETAYKMIEGFGGGFGGMQEVCSAQPQPFKCGAKVKLAAEIAGNYCPKGIMGASDFTK